MVDIGIASFEFYLGVCLLVLPLIAAKFAGKEMLCLYFVTAPGGIMAIGFGLSILRVIH